MELRIDGPEQVVDDALDAGREDGVLAILGAVGLHHPHAAERLGQPPDDLGVEPRARVGDVPHLARAPRHDHADGEEAGDRDQREQRAEPRHERERDHRGEDAAQVVEEPRAHQVLQALDVVHDAGAEGAALVRVVVEEREPEHVRLQLAAQLADEARGRPAEELGQRVRRDLREDGGAADGEDDVRERPRIAAEDDVVDEELRRDRRGHRGDARERDQDHARDQDPAPRPDDRPEVGEEIPEALPPVAPLGDQRGGVGAAHDRLSYPKRGAPGRQSAVRARASRPDHRDRDAIGPAMSK
ncbi:MAG: hypothetical protein QM820_02415 [Minicystis sp.]